jgi:predicted N-acetyltransferase YhbS
MPSRFPARSAAAYTLVVVAVTSRPYRDAADLRRMQDALARAYPITGLRVGDLAWLRRPFSHRDLARHVQLWEVEDGRIAAWAYLRSNDGFNLFVAPGAAEPALLDEVLGWVNGAARAAVEAGDPPAALYTYGLDLGRSAEERAIAAALERDGFRLAPSHSGVMTRSLDDLPAPTVPPGYRLGWVETREHVLGRVEAHRAAFAPSEVTLSTYERVRATWPYRPALDRIALADDGEVVAFATAWIDEANRAGLLEPVGTRPAHQRRGLATAVCLDALHALRAAGARTAQIGYGSEAGHATYRGLGFVDRWTDLVYRKEPA